MIVNNEAQKEKKKTDSPSFSYSAAAVWPLLRKHSGPVEANLQK